MAYLFKGADLSGGAWVCVEGQGLGQGPRGDVKGLEKLEKRGCTEEEAGVERDKFHCIIFV